MGRGALSLQNEDPTPQDGWEQTERRHTRISPCLESSKRMGRRPPNMEATEMRLQQKSAAVAKAQGHPGKARH